MKRAVFLFIFIFISLGAYGQSQENSGYNFKNIIFPGFSGGNIYFFNDQTCYWGGSMRLDLSYTFDRKRPDASFAERGRAESYLDLGLYTKDFSMLDDIVVLYTLGLNFSFETPRSLNRNFLIPYMGLELGGLHMSGKTGGFTLVPLLGINLISIPNGTANIESGILFNTAAFEDSLALRSKLTLNFVL